MADERLGYTEDPVNGDGIWRARTTRLIRGWRFDKSSATLDKLNREFGSISYPGLYVLFESSSNKVYIGEAGSVCDRLRQHTANPDSKIPKWSFVMVINDGRSSNHSELNDAVIRREIEHYLNQLFKLNKYKVVSQSSTQSLNAAQRVMIYNFVYELDFFLIKTNLINKLPAQQNQQECTTEDLVKVLKRKGYLLGNVSTYEVIVNGKKSYIRPGSKKTKGWQITFRDKFKQSLKSEDGFLIVPRGGVLVIPLQEIKKCVGNDPDAFNKNTIDIFIEYNDGGILLKYKEFHMSVSEFMI